jgi:hypothetical protein
MPSRTQHSQVAAGAWGCSGAAGPVNGNLGRPSLQGQGAAAATQRLVSQPAVIVGQHRQGCLLIQEYTSDRFTQQKQAMDLSRCLCNCLIPSVGHVPCDSLQITAHIFFRAHRWMLRIGSMPLSSQCQCSSHGKPAACNMCLIPSFFLEK